MKGLAMLTKQNEHLVPEIILNMVEKYKKLPDNNNEKVMIRSRLELIAELINKTLK